MNLTFNAIKEQNKIEVTFDKEKIAFSLDSKNNVSNDVIIKMLTNIAREIGANNFNKEKNIEALDAEELGDLKGLYEFIYSLYITFIDKFTEESTNYQAELDEAINRRAGALKRDF